MNKKIVNAIKKFNVKPSKYCGSELKAFFFTNQNNYEELEKIIRNLPKNSAVIFREYNLEKSEREQLARKIFALCKKNNCKLLVGKDFNLAKKIKANGVHFSDKDKIDFRIFLQKNYREKFLFSLACHSFSSLIKAQKSNADWLFISPVFFTNSHKEAKIIGIKNLAKMVKYSKKPLLALGGINEKNIDKVAKVGASGFGAIGMFLPN